MIDPSKSASVLRMEILAIAAALTVPTVTWALSHLRMRKLYQRLDIQARLLSEIADLIAAIPGRDPAIPPLHLVRDQNMRDLDELENFILQLHLCTHHRRVSSW